MATLFETFVNDNLPSTLRTTIPVSGNLPGGMAMVSTGVGLNTEPKMVTTFDPLYTRIVGTNSGDYATIADALASLPSGLNDLTAVTSTTARYIIYLRANGSSAPHLMNSGTILPDVSRLVFRLLAPETYQSSALISLFSAGANTFGMKFRGNTVLYATNIGNELTFDGVSVITINNGSSMVDDGQDYAAVSVEIQNSSQGSFNVYYNNAQVVASIGAFVYTLPKTIRHTYITYPNGAYSVPRVNILGMTRISAVNATSAVSVGIKIIMFDSDKYYNFYLADLSSITRNTPLLPSINVAATSNLEVIMINNAVADSYGNDAQTYRILLNNYISISYGYVAGIVNNAKITIFRFSKTSGPNLDLTNLIVRISSYNTNNIIQLTNLTILELCNTNPIAVNIDHCSVMHSTMISIPDGKIGGKFTLVKMINGWLRISNSALTNCGYKILGNTQVTVDGSDGVGNLIGNNLEDNIATTNQLVNRVANKTTQSPLPPVAPQPGDLWIKVKEQY